MMGETGVPVENHRPATSKDTLYYIKFCQYTLPQAQFSKRKF